jgi:hypothetical protein
MTASTDTGQMRCCGRRLAGDARIGNAEAGVRLQAGSYMGQVTPGVRLQAGSYTERFAPGVRRCGLAAIVAAFVCALFTANAAAGGYGHRHHGYDRGHGAVHLSFGAGRHRYRRYHRPYRRHHGSSVFFSYSAPLYLGPRYYAPAPVVIHEAPPPVVIHEYPVARVAPRQLPDMPNLAYTPQQGQDPAQTTADRQACESIAWRSSRSGPAVAATRTTRTVQQVPGYAYPDSPIPSAAGGAALGALGGAIAGDAGAGAAIGAAVGAASWLLGAASAPPRSVAQEVVVTEYVPVAGPDPQDLRRVLTDCMQSRGYAVG